jgi:5-methyltetrahydrofolate--homocysteine methyltransferase
MNKNLLARTEEKTIIFDGAMGTLLMAAGLSPGETPEVWNLEKPDVVMDIHRQYFEAGSDVVHTNTFGGNPLKLADRGLEGKMRVINSEAAKIAKEVCPERKFVAGDMGPTGKMLKPLGDLTPEEMETSFHSQATALIRGGADLISIETMFSLDEALLALKGAKRAANILVVASITYTKTKKGFFTMMGEGVVQCVLALEEAGADVIAANCTLGSQDMIPLMRELRAATRKPILVQPNAGKPITRNGVTHYRQTPSEFAQDGKDLKEAGADMIGGCCGTDPEFIRELGKAVA